MGLAFPQYFHNFNPKADIFNHKSAAYWDVILPGQDGFDVVCCTGCPFFTPPPPPPAPPYPTPSYPAPPRPLVASQQHILAHVKHPAHNEIIPLHRYDSSRLSGFLRGKEIPQLAPGQAPPQGIRCLQAVGKLQNARRCIVRSNRLLSGGHCH